jgi:uncharacterized protein YdgA (DUF945 family)
MKKIVTLVVVLVLVLVAAPWGIGRLAEDRVNSGLDQLVQEAPYLSIVERKWTSGWFRSEQEVTFEVFENLLDFNNSAEAPPVAAGEMGESAEAGEAAALLVAAETPVTEAPDEVSEGADATAGEAPAEEAPPADEADAPKTPLRFTVRNEILHGPVLWPASVGIARVNSKLVLNDEIRAKLVEIFGTDEPVRISTRVRVFGGGTTRLSGDGRTIQMKDGSGQLVYDDFKVDIGYGKHLDTVDIDGGWPKVDFAGKEGESFRMRGMALSGDSKRVLGELYDTDFNFEIDEVAFVDKQKSETSVAKIHYVVTSSLDDDFMDIGAKLGSGKVTNAQLKALSLELNEVHYDFTLRHFHAATLDKLVTAMKAMYSQPIDNAAALDAVLTKPLKEHGLELLKHDPELVVDRMGIMTPEGDGIIKGVIRLKGVTQEDLATGSMSLIGKIDADITIEVAQKLVEKVPNGATGAGMAVDQGFAKREGDKIVSRIEFKQGELKINGKAQGIPGLGGPPPQQMAPGEGVPEETSPE